MRLKDDVSLREIVDNEIIYQLQEERDELREQAKGAIERIQQENRANFNKRRKKATAYQIGDLVAIKRTQFAPGSKLYCKYLGPYKIVRVLRNDRYIVDKISECEGPRYTSVSADHMKSWVAVEYEEIDNSDDECEC